MHDGFDNLMHYRQGGSGNVAEAGGGLAQLESAVTARQASVAARSTAPQPRFRHLGTDSLASARPNLDGECPARLNLARFGARLRGCCEVRG